MRAVRLIYTNESEGHTIGDEIVPLDGATLWGDDSATLADVYREALREKLGRCASKVYRDICTAQAEHIGYFFVSRQRYEDARDPSDTYLRGVWVIVGEYRAPVAEAVL